MILKKVLLGLGAMAGSLGAQAQSTGILTYAPAPFMAIPVPIPSMILLPLSIAIAFIGYLALKSRAGRQSLGVLALLLGAGLFTFSGLQLQQAIAQAGLELGNPQGGTVEIPQGNAIYTNTSGIALNIETVSPPATCTNLSPPDECVPGLRVEAGQSCSTAFDCPQSQTITFTSTPPADAVVNGTPYEVAATATSGLPVVFSTASAACSVAGSVVTFDAEGTCVIDADQPGNADFLPAPRVQQSFPVNRQAQTITFTSTAPTDAVVNGSPYEVAATASSGLPVSFSTTSTACSVAGSTVSFIAEGSCVINADQPGNNEFLPAPQVQQGFTVSRLSQTITFTSTAPTDAIVNGGPYEVTATASSGLPVTFSTSSAACSIAGSTVSFIAEGNCVIDADQPGNAVFLPAPQAQQSFAIAAPRITFVAADPVCSFASPASSAGCTADPLTEFSISPACDANGWTVTVDWDQDANGTIDQQDVATQSAPGGADYTVTGDYPLGAHLFEVRAEDACGTVLTADIPFEIVDCKAPTPICINGLAIELIKGSQSVWATDFIASPAQDCSPPVEFSINRIGETPDRTIAGLPLSCADLGTLTIEIHGWDAVDNNDFCETFVLVQDNEGFCAP